MPGLQILCILQSDPQSNLAVLPMRKYPYVVVDVFAAKPFEGNQLAVFPDGRGLSDVEMQRIANETNLSETTFILPRDAATEAQRGTQVRIFTTQEELPFAGHPTVGTSLVLRGVSKAPKVELDLKVGKIPVTFEDTPTGAWAEMTQRDPEFGQTHRREDLAAIAGLDPADIRDDIPIQTVDTGMPFCIVPVRTLAAIQKMRVTWSAVSEYVSKTDAKFIFWIAAEAVEKSSRFHARMIFYNGEDPATGSACGCAAAYLRRYGLIGDGENAIIEQGFEIKRPSRIRISADLASGKVVNVRVAGQSIEVARGEFFLP